MSQNQQREQLGSRIGFLLLAAGCAIGLGNVWRFPYIAGAYGGALFVFIYIGFLLAVGVPILVMEFSVGRAAQRNLGAALQKLEPKGSRWHTFGPLSLIGSYLLMMFYTTVAGWMLAYCWSMLKGDLSGLTPEQVGGFFGGDQRSDVILPLDGRSGDLLFYRVRHGVAPGRRARGEIHDGRPGSPS